MHFRSVTPISGRVVLRPLSDGSGALLGVLQLPGHFAVVESAGYPLFLSDSGLRVYDPPFDAGPSPDVDGYGINASLAARDWPEFAEIPELMMVRFIAAFPEQNVWTVYGATRHVSIRSVNLRATDTWFDVDNQGQLQEIAAPAEEYGYTCSQLLTAFCVWPNADGTLHCLAEHPSRWRPVYLRHSEVTAQLGDGTLSEEEYYRLIRQDAELARVAPLHPDLEYARFLARLKSEGGVEIIRPMTVDQKQTREARATRILREMLNTT
jgi:hypothetical protein